MYNTYSSVYYLTPYKKFREVFLLFNFLSFCLSVRISLFYSVSCLYLLLLLLLLLFCCCFVVVLLLFCCCFVVVLLLFCCCFVVVLLLLLLFCCCFVVVLVASVSTRSAIQNFDDVCSQRRRRVETKKLKCLLQTLVLQNDFYSYAE